MPFKQTLLLIAVFLLATQVTAKGQERTTIRRKRKLPTLVNPYLPVASTKSPTPAPTKAPKNKNKVAGAIQTSSGNQMQVTATISTVAAALVWLGL